MKALIAQDNVYFTDRENKIGFAILYEEKYKHKTTGEVLYYAKDLSSYNYIGELGINELDSLCENARLNTGANTLDWNSCYGRILLSVHECDYAKIQNVIRFILNAGHRIYLNDGSQLTLNPNITYSWEMREQLLLQNYLKFKSMFGWDVLKCTISTEWKNAERVKLLELKQFMISEFPDDNNNDNSISWRNLLNKEIQNTINTENTKNTEVDDEGLCIICCTNEAETYLESCGHIVVCEECSDNLAKSNNPEIRDKCIYCKQNINQITYIKSMKIVKLK